jgi:hypothetical protein
VPLDDTLMVVTDDFLTEPVLELVLRLVPDAAVFDPESLLTAAICHEISEMSLGKSDM